MEEDIKGYVGLKLSIFRLKLANDISKALGQIVSILLIVAVLDMFLALLAYVLIQVLNGVVGSPWGAVIVCAFFLLVLLVLFAFRKKLFHGMFVKIFLEDDCPEVNSVKALENRIESVQKRIEEKENNYSCGWKNARTCLGYANVALRLFGLIKGRRPAK